MVCEDRFFLWCFSFLGRRMRYNGFMWFIVLSIVYVMFFILLSCFFMMSFCLMMLIFFLEGVKVLILMLGLGKVLLDYMCRYIFEGGLLLEFEVF